jgi:hypothetical protein
MPLESHLNVKTTVNVSAHRLSAYQRALDGCIDPVLAESTIGVSEPLMFVLRWLVGASSNLLACRPPFVGSHP